MSTVATSGASGFRSWIGRMWAAARPWIWQVAVVVLVLIFILTWVRPFEKQRDPTADDIATAWNQSIDRLGILPVYPPAEDFHVGDLWAVIDATEDTPLLGKGVRIAHIDLRAEIAADEKGPLFADTADVKTGENFRRQSPSEIKRPEAAGISLSIAAFPGITIKHTERGAGSAGTTFLGFGASREDEEEEEIRIPMAETYGAPTVLAFVKLNEFCKAKETIGYCNDEVVRRILAYSVSDRVLAAAEGNYRTRIQLRLVTRVYTTREIQHKRSRKGSRGGEAGTAAADAKPGAAPTVKSGEVAPTDTHEAASATAGQNAATIRILRGDESQIQLNQIFQRPVAFGYRALTIALPPSKPSPQALP